MPTPAASFASLQEQIDIIVNSAPKYLKGASDQTQRDHKIIRMMKQHGTIMFNAADYIQVMNVEVYEPEVHAGVDGGRIDFQASRGDEQLTFDLRGATVRDLMTEKEYLLNQGNPRAIVDRYDRKIEKAKTAADRHFGESFYVDGSQAAYAKHYQGVGSFLGRDTGYAVVATDRAAVPGVNYAGQSTAVGWFGGEWQSGSSTCNAALGNSWPFGKGSSEYDALSPVLLNWSSTAWAGSTSIKNNIEPVIGFMTTVMQNRTGREYVSGAPNIMVIDPALFATIKDHFRDRNRQIVPTALTQDLGLPGDSILIDGCYICHDYGMGNTNEGIFLSTEHMEMYNVHDDLYKIHGPEYSISDNAYLMLLTAYGNYRFNPKYFGKIAAYA